MSELKDYTVEELIKMRDAEKQKMEDCGYDEFDDLVYQINKELEERGHELCPECDAILEACVGSYGDITYDGLRCPNGCNLFDAFGVS